MVGLFEPKKIKNLHPPAIYRPKQKLEKKGANFQPFPARVFRLLSDVGNLSGSTPSFKIKQWETIRSE
jgi:hypothetical protein